MTIKTSEIVNCLSYLPRIALALCFTFLLACDSTTVNSPLSAEEADELDLDLNDPTGPVDFGDAWDPVESAAARASNPEFHRTGNWSNAGNWPISAIHMSLLSDGRVLSYGTGTNVEDDTNERGAGFTFDLWTTGNFNPSSHQTLPTGIDTNVFCSAQTVLPNGNVLLSGGDKSTRTDKTHKLNGVTATTLYNVETTAITEAEQMNAARWYPTLVPMPDGRQLVLGGKDSNIKEDDKIVDKVIPAFPEIYNPETGKWTKLNGAANAAFFDRNWFYPRAFLKTDGKVVIIDRVNRNNKDDVYELNVEGNGSLTKIGSIPANFAKQNSPAAMFDKDKILFVDQTGRTMIVDVSGGTVGYNITAAANTNRIWGNTTIMANGEVFLSGGRGPAKTSEEKLEQSVYKGQIWNPDTRTWKNTASGAKPRLYHSTAILLPSARVLIAGGGPPGPVVNLNAERFQPPYLFDEDGNLAARPSINSVGDVRYNNSFTVVLKEAANISRVTFIRAGSDTHSFDQGQRFMELAFSQTDQLLEVTAPTNAAAAPPGLYMLFVLNDKGVPSAAKLIMM